MASVTRQAPGAAKPRVGSELPRIGFGIGIWGYRVGMGYLGEPGPRSRTHQTLGRVAATMAGVAVFSGGIARSCLVNKTLAVALAIVIGVSRLLG